MSIKNLSNRVAEYVTTCKDEDLSEIKVDRIAAEFGVNPSYLSRKFKSDKDITLIEFITGDKMSRSARLLKNDRNTTIHSLTELTGFSRSDYFVTVFKNYYGIHPVKYKKQHNH